MTNDVFILGGARTPMTEYRRAEGRLGDRARRDRARAARSSGPASSPSGSITSSSATCCRRAPTRSTARATSALKAGVPIEVPALTVNRLCGSGIQAAVSGAQHDSARRGRTSCSTGGMENMSQAPHVIRGLRSGLQLGQGKLEDSLWAALLDPLLRLHDGADRRELRREVRHLARGAGRVRAAQPAARATRRGTTGRFDGRSRAGRDQDAQGRRRSSTATITCGRTRRWRGSRSCRRRSGRTAASPPATPAASSTAAPR